MAKRLERVKHWTFYNRNSKQIVCTQFQLYVENHHIIVVDSRVEYFFQFL